VRASLCRRVSGRRSLGVAKVCVPAVVALAAMAPGGSVAGPPALVFARGVAAYIPVVHAAAIAMADNVLLNFSIRYKWLIVELVWFEFGLFVEK